MRIASIQYPVFNPYNKPALEVYLYGCKRQCEGCHNPELRDFKKEGEEPNEVFFNYLESRTYFFDVLAVSGGDLLCQDEKEAFEFSLEIHNRFKDKELWLFTGEDDFDKIPLWAKQFYDVIKYGHFDKTKITGENDFPISSNQKIWKKKKDGK